MCYAGLVRRDLTYWECSFLSNSPSFCHPWKKLLNKSDLMFSFLEDRRLGETSSFAPKRTVVENMNYGVSCGWRENVRSGHLSGDRIHRFPSSFCWGQRYCVWCDCGFVVQQGLLTAIQISGKARQEIPSPYCSFFRMEAGVWVSCLTLWVTCFLEMLKWMIWNRQSLAFVSCSWEGQEICSPIDICWNSQPSSQAVPPGQEVQVRVILLVTAKGIKILCKCRNLTLEAEDLREI